MKFNITVSHRDHDLLWVEAYDRAEVKNVGDAVRWAEALIDKFNRTLRPGERARKVLAVTRTGDSSAPPHDWGKTNLVTVSDHGQYYDTMECVRCGVTGKRYGLDNTIIIDQKFKDKKYERCEV
jgi:hypothetical protein